MNWDDVRIFLAVARTGQLLGAARRLGMNHATVSRRVGALEKAMETRLLDRRTNGCTLTDEGDDFLHAAERMEAEMLAAQSTLAAHDRSVSGTVRVGAPDGFGVAFLAPRLGTLADRHPHLTVQLVPVPQSFSLSQREADIAITIDRPSEGRLVCRRLVDYTLGLYASKAYVARHDMPRTLDDLKQHPLIGYVADLLFSASLDFASEFNRSWTPSIEISSALGQTEAVRAGAGIGILHSYIADNDPDFVPIFPDRRVHRTYWTVMHESLRHLARIRTVSDYLCEIVAAERGAFASSTPP